ncbi:MAG: NAD(P)-binding domain-containing protein, partial [Tepidiformaceae bacterium]
GERVRARRVVVAVGLSYFAEMPSVFAGVSTDLASHTAVHGDFSRFRGLDVTVIGAGQSALQAGALLHENGANVRLLARGHVVWHGRTAKGVRRTLKERLRAPNSMVGPGRENWMMQHAPTLLHYLPADRRLAFTRGQLGPAGAWWLKDRVQGKVPIETGISVTNATVEHGGLRLRTSDINGAERDLHTDHVIAGTGYRVDVNRIAFLHPDLAHAIRTTDGAPVLSRHFESSVDGLYFVGPASAASFGPLFRFVVGSYYTVPRLARHLTGSASRKTHPWRSPVRNAREI